ncbi:MAG: hypothetical protein DSY90_14375 [Deltaproteobacteria bacterium]|nr:MAG: hypothetical protein DSY90_14375 [Deltaproteobacteria bacterium]
MKIVVVGNGIAGNCVAFGMRARSRDHEICILSAEKVPEYDPCALPYFIGGDVPHEAVFRKSIQDYRRHDIDLMLDQRVVAIDPRDRRVTTAQGREVPYDKLVLAHGGQLFIPPIEGIRLPGVFNCKQLDAAKQLREHNGRRAVVIGSGAIGIEVAEALHKKGFQVTVIELLDWVLPALFDRETAQRFEAVLADSGVRVLKSEKVLAVEGNGTVSGVVTDKRRIDCDAVVVATGVVPDKSMAATAGVDTERGINVDRHLQTNVADIYACGDCIETVDSCTGEDVMFQLKHNAIDQAAVVVANLAGEPVSYAGAYAFARVHFGRMHAVSFGKSTLSTQCQLGDLKIVERENGPDYLRLILKDNLIVGGQAIGKFADYAGFFMGAMRRGDDFAYLRRSRASVCSLQNHYRWAQRLIGDITGLC